MGSPILLLNLHSSTRTHFSAMFKAFLLLVGLAPVALAAAVPPPTAPTAEAQSLVALRVLDQRVAAIGHRLATRNLDLCRERQFLPGFALHDLSQYGPAYRPAAIQAFGLDAGPGVLALVPDGPAARAGIQIDDVLLSVDGAPLPRGAPGPRQNFDQAERILGAIEAAFADGRAEIEIRRDGQSRRVPVAGETGCASRFQLVPSGALNARADGRYVQVTTAIGNYVEDDGELAAVLAHEFAHNVLHHRVRLDEAGVSRGLLGNFGGNARSIRVTEVEADRLSVYLMERAGYDPDSAVRFWSRFGRRGLNFLGSPTHPNWRRRIALFQAEIDRIRAARAAGQVPMPDFLPPAPAARP
jgi:hypothetical protein